MVCGWTGGAGLAREVVSADGELYHGATRMSLLGYCGEVTVRSLGEACYNVFLRHHLITQAMVLRWLEVAMVVMVNIQLGVTDISSVLLCCSVGDVSTLN